MGRSLPVDSPRSSAQTYTSIQSSEIPLSYTRRRTRRSAISSVRRGLSEYSQPSILTNLSQLNNASPRRNTRVHIHLYPTDLNDLIEQQQQQQQQQQPPDSVADSTEDYTAYSFDGLGDRDFDRVEDIQSATSIGHTLCDEEDLDRCTSFGDVDNFSSIHFDEDFSGEFNDVGDDQGLVLDEQCITRNEWSTVAGKISIWQRKQEACDKLGESSLQSNV